MSATGTTTIDFGGKSTDTTVTVTGQASILADSLVEAWILPASTASNTSDNHWVDDIEVFAGNVQAGTGFTIYAKCRTGFAHGVFNIGWVWK